VTYGCLSIHQSSTVQRYRIYRLIEYIRNMFTTESSTGNQLIQMQLILACKVHIRPCIPLYYNHSPLMWGIVGYIESLMGNGGKMKREGT